MKRLMLPQGSSAAILVGMMLVSLPVALHAEDAAALTGYGIVYIDIVVTHALREGQQRLVADIFSQNARICPVVPWMSFPIT